MIARPVVGIRLRDRCSGPVPRTPMRTRPRPRPAASAHAGR
ncbi:hypothetical protein SCATT_p16100 (plasmid) [Streptantibioticus cattleyicolor NRRL 8057 = DSM 46488]|uniref:Uncharacterized protein n=1 Tax=Streptantibioticus cattleyicolor (strain ATCC 35852 / DSM 46488 / JCM 4925 / NBRC 14057 / NRRL 8057) TaxID=1003195 RepID=G8XHG5_STREN|nr:hypothetical protein SCATT_p16100 [Streptantibioticus cattleyicolor NRRL 8057 = DSM 46488]